MLPPTQEKLSAHPADQNSSAAENAQRERIVRIVELPPRTISDWIALICTLILTVAGIGGIIVAICTLKRIETQTRATVIAAKSTRKSAEATKKAAEATRKSVELQEILNRQWLEISGWRREGGGSREDNPPRFTIAADISNPTNAPLTVKSATIGIVGNDSMEYEIGNTLAPNGEPIKITYSYTVKAPEIAAYEKYALPLVVDGFVVFVDCFGKEQRQDFMRACFLGPKHFDDAAVHRRNKK